MNNKFNENYYKTNNYSNYLSKKERYVKTADELYHTLKKLSIMNYETKILDYGCGVGFLLEGLDKIGCKNVYGYDISEWAIQQASNSGCKILKSPEGTFDLAIFLDVLEHMTDEEIVDLFKKIKVETIIVRIPCSIESMPNIFYLEVSRRDETHINCKTDKDWINFFNLLGYRKHFRLNLNTIYDSDGCFCCIFIK